MSRSLRIALTIIVLLVAGWYMGNHYEDFLVLLRFDPLYLPPLLGLAFVAVVINGLVLNILVGEFGIELRFQEWFGLTVIHAFGNYLPVPQAGTLARAVYLKKVRRLDYGSFLGTVAATYTIFLSTVGVLGLFCLLWMAKNQNVAPLIVWGLFGGLASVAFLVALLPRIKLERMARWNVVKAMESLMQPLVMTRVALLQAALAIVAGTSLWLAFSSLDVRVGYTSAFFLAIASMISGIVNVTPGNIGVAESVAWATAHLLGVSPETTVVSYTLFRLTSILVIFSISPFFVSSLSKAREESSLARRGVIGATDRTNSHESRGKGPP